MDRQGIKVLHDHQADTAPLIAIAGPPPMVTGASFHMGESRSPSGSVISVDSRSLLLDGKPWLPVMGEFHYSRYSRRNWREELLKMKLGGLDIVASYVLWIHHEEIEGHFDWEGQCDLAEFVRLCGEASLYTVVRCGPWCHAECRNGGLPDWLLAKGFKVRSDDPAYLEYVRKLYAEIAAQIKGYLWKDGGPVIGIQVENEYGGPAEHLLTLKRLAQEAGIDVPLYTRTGWPKTSTRVPIGELLPLFGGYPDGFWDRSIAQMPPSHQENFLFRMTRTEAATGSDQLGAREARDDDDIHCYPYFACEIGGGMMTSYHRRIRISPKDIESLALAKIGSGSNLQGYYMYHGGTNPDGKLSTLQESQSTGYWNDLPVKTYDYQAPLGEFGQVREHYHLLRRMHLFLRDFGSELATMPPRLPETQPRTAADVSTLRWCIRTNGRSGLLFINNYQRLQNMPCKENVQFDLQLAKGDLRLPAEPTRIPANSCFFWPFDFDLDGAHLVYATAQPVCRLEDGQTTYFVFCQIEGVPAEFVFDRASVAVITASGEIATSEHGIRITEALAGTGTAVQLRTENGSQVSIILLDSEQALGCWKAELMGRERLFVTRASLLTDGDTIRLRASNARDMAVSILPAPAMVGCSGERLTPEEDGLFSRFTPCSGDQALNCAVGFEQVKCAGAARPVRFGAENVAEAPTDEDFDQSAWWRLNLSEALGPTRDALLRISYVGDVARLYVGGKLIADNFYNAAPFEIGLKRFAPAIYKEEVILKVLPLRKDAPIYLPADAWPDFGDSGQAAALDSIDLVEELEAVFTPARFSEPTPSLRTTA